MAFPLTLAVRYLGSKKRASISVGTAIAVLGVTLGVAALLTVMSVTGGFQSEFRDKVLGVNAHVLVLKHSTEFRNYRDIMEQVRAVPGVQNVAPFSINPMMLARGEKTATGVLLKGVDPETSLGVGQDPSIPPVLDLPRHVFAGESGTCALPIEMSCGIKLLAGLRREGAKPPPPRNQDTEPLIERRRDPLGEGGNSGGAPDWLREGLELDRPNAPGSVRPPERQAPPVPSALPPTGSLVPHDSRVVEDGALGQNVGEEEAPEAAAVGEGGAAPQGRQATPDGGYKSVLPDDDELPPGIVRDECEDPEEIKKLPGIVVGKALAETLDLKMGDCVTVTSPTIGFQFSGGAVKPAIAKNFRVMAMFEAGFDQYDSKLVYTDLYEAQAFYDEGDTVTGVEMKIADIEDSDEVVAAVKAVMPPGAYRVMDWKELNHGLFTALLIQKVLMSGVLALIILVAAFTVVATLIMVVLDKKKEISVLKAMGATDFSVLRIFLYQGLFIGGAGTALGLGLGYAVCQGLIVWAFPLDPKVYFIDHLPVLVRAEEFILTGEVALILCLMGTALPSLYAASLLPADGFRDMPGGSSTLEAPEILSTAWQVFGSRWMSLLFIPVALRVGTLLAVMHALYGGVASFIGRPRLPDPADLKLGLGLLLVGVLLTEAITIALNIGAVREKNGEKSGLLLSLRRAVPRLPSFAAVWLLRQSLLAVLIGALLAITALAVAHLPGYASVLVAGLCVALGVPVLVLALGTKYAPYMALGEGDSPLQSFRKSWQATEGRRTDLVIYGVATAIVVSLGMLCALVGGVVAMTVVSVGEAVIFTRVLRSVTHVHRAKPAPRTVTA